MELSQKGASWLRAHRRDDCDIRRGNPNRWKGKFTSYSIHNTEETRNKSEDSGINLLNKTKPPRSIKPLNDHKFIMSYTDAETHETTRYLHLSYHESYSIESHLLTNIAPYGF